MVSVEVGGVMRPEFAIHLDDDAVKAPEFRHGYFTEARRVQIQAALLNAPNDKVEQLAAKGLSTPQDGAARLLHRLVRR